METFNAYHGTKIGGISRLELRNESAARDWRYFDYLANLDAIWLADDSDRAANYVAEGNDDDPYCLLGEVLTVTVETDAIRDIDMTSDDPDDDIRTAVEEGAKVLRLHHPPGTHGWIPPSVDSVVLDPDALTITEREAACMCGELGECECWRDYQAHVLFVELDW